MEILRCEETVKHKSVSTEVLSHRRRNNEEHYAHHSVMVMLQMLKEENVKRRNTLEMPDYKVSAL